VARAESPRREIAFSSIFSPSSEMAQNFRISFGGICAFAKTFFSPRIVRLARAARNTRSRTVAESSIALGAQFLVLHGGHFDVDVDAVDQRPGNF